MNELIQFIDGQGASRTIANHYTHSFGEISRSAEGSDVNTDVYVVNFEDEQGFAILASDERLPGVFALTESGSLDLSQPIENPGLEIFVSSLDDYMAVAAMGFERDSTWGPGLVDGVFYGPWETVDTIGTKIRARWGQGAPYNAGCFTLNGHKQALAGCNAIAVAQIMYHHAFPANYTYDGITYYFDWPLIKGNSTINSTMEAAPMVANLIVMLNKPTNLGAHYGVDDTYVEGINMPETRETFRNFGYSSAPTVRDYSVSDIRSSLSNNRPVIISGFRNRIIFDIFPVDGHVWVIDAAITQRSWHETVEEGVLIAAYYNYRDLFHYNWGYNGEDNGYFLADVFGRDEGTIYDQDHGDSERDYKYHVKIIPNIHP